VRHSRLLLLLWLLLLTLVGWAQAKCSVQTITQQNHLFL
jgi:hypothetical protein